jgi:CheY-like chemotaxis protein
MGRCEQVSMVRQRDEMAGGGHCDVNHPIWDAGSVLTGERKPGVLIVDDEPDIRVLARFQLAAGGRFEVVGEASEGAEAVTAAERLHPDAIVLDLSMPGMSGEQALPHLRRVAPSADIVVCSALPREDCAASALAAGAGAFLTKTDLGQLERVLVELQAKRSAS